ncbi:extracellular solute-binding protein, partial [Faecalibacterium prausnitzii]|uniref:extracellular solute-binding protein n=1 Tax=Faecalibacterium prausnitzii TaxID=853 RepID=UPI003F52C924
MKNETLHRVCETIVDMGKRKACYLANSWSDYIDQSIQGDMVAGVLNGNWIIPTMEAVTENSGKWEITTIPTLDGGEGYASNGGCGLYITANCGNVDLAKSFLAYTFGGSTQTYDNALRDGGVVTTVLKCADSDVYNEGVAFFNNEPIYKQIVAFAGPPAVRLTDSSNSCKVPLMDMMAVITMVGISSGTVIF